MQQIKIIRSDEVKPQFLRGLSAEGGQAKRIILTEKMFLNLDEVNPGFTPHRWHTHTKDKTEESEIDYPKDFEEIYFILSGRGVIQWKTESGEIQEQEAGPGDTIHMPPGIGEHQLLNNGPEKMILIVMGCPPPQKTYKSSG
jgi:oxalate decarboxylase/phosphoglucose isomerase-like protein (cupin superfamily)